MKKENENCNYMTIEETAAYLNLRLSRLRYLVYTKSIPYIKIRRSLRFNKKELTDWLALLSQPAQKVAWKFRKTRIGSIKRHEIDGGKL